MPYRLTKRAAADLLEIAAYTARQWGDAQAVKYRSFFNEAFQRIGDDPQTAGSRARDGLLAGCRILTVEQHIVVYRRREGTTEILRILHQRMNLPLQRLL